jgi:hypothetical protein
VRSPDDRQGKGPGVFAPAGLSTRRSLWCDGDRSDIYGNSAGAAPLERPSFGFHELGKRQAFDIEMRADIRNLYGVRLHDFGGYDSPVFRTRALAITKGSATLPPRSSFFCSMFCWKRGNGVDPRDKRAFLCRRRRKKLTVLLRPCQPANWTARVTAELVPPSPRQPRRGL